MDQVLRMKNQMICCDWRWPLWVAQPSTDRLPLPDLDIQHSQGSLAPVMI